MASEPNTASDLLYKGAQNDLQKAIWHYNQDPRYVKRVMRYLKYIPELLHRQLVTYCIPGLICQKNQQKSIKKILHHCCWSMGRHICIVPFTHYRH